MAVAVPVTVGIWVVGSDPTPPVGQLLLIGAAGLLTTLILGTAAKEAIKRYADRRLRLLGPLSHEPS
jgi:hypothetical protein